MEVFEEAALASNPFRPRPGLAEHSNKGEPSVQAKPACRPEEPAPAGTHGETRNEEQPAPEEQPPAPAPEVAVPTEDEQHNVRNEASGDASGEMGGDAAVHGVGVESREYLGELGGCRFFVPPQDVLTPGPPGANNDIKKLARLQQAIFPEANLQLQPWVLWELHKEWSYSDDMHKLFTGDKSLFEIFYAEPPAYSVRFPHPVQPRRAARCTSLTWFSPASLLGAHPLVLCHWSTLPDLRLATQLTPLRAAGAYAGLLGGTSLFQTELPGHPAQDRAARPFS